MDLKIVIMKKAYIMNIMMNGERAVKRRLLASIDSIAADVVSWGNCFIPLWTIYEPKGQCQSDIQPAMKNMYSVLEINLGINCCKS